MLTKNYNLMKNILYLFLVLSSIGMSCKNDTSIQEETVVVNEKINAESVVPNTTENDEDLTATSTKTIPIEKQKALPKPELDEEDKKIAIQQKKDSHFNEIVCCDDAKFQDGECCCKDVIERYKKIYLSEDFKLSTKITTEDPIFNACKKQKKWRVLIEEIENEEEDLI